MALDRKQLEQALARAATLDAERPDDLALQAADVERLGAELGLSSESFRQAVVEVSGAASGFLTVGAQGFVPGDSVRVGGVLSTYLRLRGLIPTGGNVWRQRGGWWPDLYRFTAVTPVAVTVTPAGDRSYVGMTAGLDRIFRAHLVAAVLGVIGAVVLFFTRPGPFQLLAVVTLLGAWLLFDLWSFRRRQLAIEQRLRAALGDISDPRYRLQPW